MMKTFTVCDSLGNILENHTTDEKAGFLLQPPVGGKIIVSDVFHHTDFSWKNQYILGDNFTDKIEMPCVADKPIFLADGIDFVTITNIPKGASVLITGTIKAGPEIIEDGELTITSNTVGGIDVKITLNPNYKDWSVKLNAS